MTASKRPGKPIRTAGIDAGVIGLGLMGHSIIACLLAAGHRVVAITRSLEKSTPTRRKVLSLLRQMKREGLLKRDPAVAISKFEISDDYRTLSECGIVIESI